MGGDVFLGAADVFQRVHDGDMRAEGRAGNQTAFVMELDGRVDERALAARLARAAALVPELSARVAGLFPWSARWAPTGRPPPVEVVDAAGRALDDVAAARLDAPVATGGSVAADVVRLPERDAVVLRVHHALADARSLDRLATWLGAGEGPEPPPPPTPRFATSPLDGLPRARRLELMRAYNERVIALGAEPVLSPASPAPGRPAPRRPGATRALRVRLDEAATRALDARVRAEAGLAETAFFVTVAARAVVDLLERRGLAPSRVVVPVPASLDPKAGATRLLGNHVTLLMLALERADLEGRRRALASLAEQQRMIVRGKHDLGALAALDFARYLPRFAYRRVERGPMRGEIGSFVLSNPGPVTTARFLGRRVVDAHPLPAVVSSPGLQLVVSRFAGRLSIALGFVDAVVEAPEASRLATLLAGDLCPAP
jgi:hypothetical protein